MSKKKKDLRVFVTYIGKEYADGIGDYYFVAFYYMDEPHVINELNTYMFLSRYKEYT